MRTAAKASLAAALVLVAGVAVRFLFGSSGDARERGGAGGPVPVEVAPVQVGPIELRRTYSGTLEPGAEFVVAPKIGGRIERLNVDLADPVTQGQEVARLDDDEFVQAVRQAEAELAVARADLLEAESSLRVAEREMERALSLQQQGITSDQQVETATAEHQAQQAAVAMAKARIQRAQAALEASKVRLRYTRVTASWSGDGAARVVGERHAQEGDTVSANTPLMSIVRLHPIKAVLFVTERDYGLLRTGQGATLSTDAFPGRTFPGRIGRIAPVFRRSSRQARVELDVDNQDRELKPGMFVRAEIILDRSEREVTVPVAAIVRRKNVTGVFVVEGDRAAWRPVETGIRDADRIAVRGRKIEGRVVTLGQQLIRDGSRVLVPPAAKQP